MKAFLICPVLGHAPDAWKEQVASLESAGWQVHWPPRDTDQDDPIGLEICKQNAEAIRAADRVFVIWNGKSQGSAFDLGVAFAFGKPITVLSAPERTPGKSFQNMMKAWEDLDGRE